MNHLEALNLLDDYHDGELPRELAAEVGLHATGCAECQAALGSRVVLSRTLADAVRIEPSERFVQAVAARIAAERTAEAGWVRWLMPSMAAALAAASMAIVIGLDGATTLSAAAAGDPLAAVEAEAVPRAQALAGARAFTPDEVLVALEEPR